MQKPEMIIFDYGHTLLYQPDFNTSNGNKAIYPYTGANDLIIVIFNLSNRIKRTPTDHENLLGLIICFLRNNFYS